MSEETDAALATLRGALAACAAERDRLAVQVAALQKALIEARRAGQGGS